MSLHVGRGWPLLEASECCSQLCHWELFFVRTGAGVGVYAGGFLLLPPLSTSVDKVSIVVCAVTFWI